MYNLFSKSKAFTFLGLILGLCGYCGEFITVARIGFVRILGMDPDEVGFIRLSGFLGVVSGLSEIRMTSTQKHGYSIEQWQHLANNFLSG